MIEIALYQPDIAENAGAVIRMAACLGIAVAIIEPAGFIWPSPRLSRAAMDYFDKAELRRDVSFEAFRKRIAGRRMVLMTTKAETGYLGFRFRPGDVLLMGRESAGVPDSVHALADHRITIPMRPGLRALNVAMAAAMVTGEALRQLGASP